jgi:hypothetical protein
MSARHNKEHIFLLNFPLPYPPGRQVPGATDLFLQSQGCSREPQCGYHQSKRHTEFQEGAVTQAVLGIGLSCFDTRHIGSERATVKGGSTSTWSQHKFKVLIANATHTIQAFATSLEKWALKRNEI